MIAESFRVHQHKGVNAGPDRLPMRTGIKFLKFLDDLELQRDDEAKLGRKKFKLIATVFRIVLFALVSLSPLLWADDVAVSLPDGVRAMWDVTKAYHETTPTRERICLNGLWRWQPTMPGPTRFPPAVGVSSKCPDAGRGSPTTCRRIPRCFTRIQAGKT